MQRRAAANHLHELQRRADYSGKQRADNRSFTGIA